MRRSTPLRRRTALRPGGPLTRSTPLRARVAGSAARSAKSGRRTGESYGREVVRARAGALCEACGQRPAVHWHHRMNRSQGGTWAPANGMHVCVECHTWIGNYSTSAGLLGWHLEHHQDPAAEPLRYRGAWVVLDDDGAVTPTALPDRAAESRHPDSPGAAA